MVRGIEEIKAKYGKYPLLRLLEYIYEGALPMARKCPLIERRGIFRTWDLEFNSPVSFPLTLEFQGSLPISKVSY